MKISPRSCRLKIAYPVVLPGRSATNDPVGLNGNNVSLDREARLLAENALRYNLASTLARAQLRLVRAAIQEKT